MDCLKCPLHDLCAKEFPEGKPFCASEENSHRQGEVMEELHRRHIVHMSIKMSLVGIGIILLLIAVGMAGCPAYNVYKQKMGGRGILAHAQSSREVAVAEAKAKMESAVLLAAADTLRAQGVARSNIIIGQSLTESYLRWFWISELKPGGQVIYVPTEANLPILEAAKR